MIKIIIEEETVELALAQLRELAGSAGPTNITIENIMGSADLSDSAAEEIAKSLDELQPRFLKVIISEDGEISVSAGEGASAKEIAQHGAAYEVLRDSFAELMREGVATINNVDRRVRGEAQMLRELGWDHVEISSGGTTRTLDLKMKGKPAE